jgi:hypothetical protein
MSDLGSGVCKNPKCEKTYKRKRIKQAYCSPKCRMDHWVSKHPRVAIAV